VSVSGRHLPRETRERRIIDAAREVFSRRGFHAASVDEIAELAGASKPTVYAVVGPKEDLFRACIRREAERLVVAMRTAADPKLPPEEQLWRSSRAFFEFVGENPESWQLLFHRAPALGEAFAAEVADRHAWVIDVVAELLGNIGRTLGSRISDLDREIEVMAHALVGACESLADWLAQHPGESPDVTATRLVNFAWMGLSALRDGQVWLPHQPRAEEPA
jgi:AcrR family transcriptional regulator